MENSPDESKFECFTYPPTEHNGFSNNWRQTVYFLDFQSFCFSTIQKFKLFIPLFTQSVARTEVSKKYAGQNSLFALYHRLVTITIV